MTMTGVALLQLLVHYGLHLVAPLGIARWFYPERWKRVYLILLGTMLVDLDHLLADPVFDPDRCSIGFHPLHSHEAIAVYCVLLLFRRTRVVAIGLVFHMLTDFQDCFWP